MGHLRGPGLGMVQAEAVRILLAIETRERRKEVYDRIKVALVGSNPLMLPELYPDLFPELKKAMDDKNDEAIAEAWTENGPMEVVSVIDPSDAFALLGRLDAGDLGVM